VVTSRRDLRNFGHEEDRNAPVPAESRILDEPTRIRNRTSAERDGSLSGTFASSPSLRYDDKPSFDDGCGSAGFGAIE